jgi:RHH-type proline utilization regulon transcriptional repressor/proline dehydrogenase/delta 1-pyrroline-5-carboxylate dehydrogenase
VADARVQGVMFTGSTEVARLLQRNAGSAVSTRDGKPVPLIAETGGQNAMIVDSSALAEQVVADVLLGLRQRRPALLGAARAVPAGRRGRPCARDAQGRDGRTAIGNPDRWPPTWAR